VGLERRRGLLYRMDLGGKITMRLMIDESLSTETELLDIVDYNFSE